MAFTNLFRRNSAASEIQGASYACIDENSITETLLDELETQCQHHLSSASSKTKRNSEVIEHAGGLLGSTYMSLSKRRSSVDYSWLTPQNNPLQAQHDLYRLPDILKMELSLLIRNVTPEDCTLVVNQFRRHTRSQTKATTPENIIALFRKTLAEYIDEKHKNRRNSNESRKNVETNSLITSSVIRNNRIIPNRESEDNTNPIGELSQISFTSSQHESTSGKPRSSTYT